MAAAERYAAPEDGEDGLATAVASARISDEQPPPPPPRPARWTRYVDDASGRPYWHDTVSGLTTWDDPAEGGGRRPAAEAPPPGREPPSPRDARSSTSTSRRWSARSLIFSSDPASSSPMMIERRLPHQGPEVRSPIKLVVRGRLVDRARHHAGRQRGGPPTKFFVLVHAQPPARAAGRLGFHPIDMNDDRH